MHRIAKTMIFIIAAVSVNGYMNAERRLKGICDAQEKDKAFTNVPQKVTQTYDAFREYSNGRKLGGGAFGEVRKVNYYHPANKNGVAVGERIAMKKIKPQNDQEVKLIVEEILAMKSVAHSPHFPTIFGCAYKNNDEVVIAQSFASHSLDTKTFRDAMALNSIEVSLRFYRAWFEGLYDLWKAGYSHCDVKPQNMMTDVENKAPKIIDLGLAQKTGTRNEQRGTPIYMAPTKFDSRTYVAQKEDMYSTALSIAAIEAPKGVDDVLYQPGVDAISGCFKGSNPRHCRDKLVRNMITILQKAGYGKRLSSVSETDVNFTTLMCLMVEYDSFNWDYPTVLKILDRLIAEETAKGNHLKIAEDEKKARETEVQQLLQTRKEIEAIESEEEKLKVKKEEGKKGFWKELTKSIRDQKEKDKKALEDAVKKGVDPQVAKKAQDLRNKAEGNPKNYVPANNAYLNELKLQMKRDEERLAQLDKEKKAKVDYLRRNDIEAYKQGQVYKENKPLLMPVNPNAQFREADYPNELNEQLKALEGIKRDEALKVQKDIQYTESLGMAAKMFDDFEAQNKKNQALEKQILEKQALQALQRKQTLERQNTHRRKYSEGVKPLEVPAYGRKHSNPPKDNLGNQGYQPTQHVPEYKKEGAYTYEALKTPGNLKPLTQAEMDKLLLEGGIRRMPYDPDVLRQDIYRRPGSNPNKGLPINGGYGVRNIGDRVVGQILRDQYGGEPTYGTRKYDFTPKTTDQKAIDAIYAKYGLNQQRQLI